MTSPYAGNFHETRNRETEYAAAVILQLFIEENGVPESVIDVGCGVGTFLRAAQQQGASTILGLDGPWVRRDLLMVDPKYFSICDFEKLQIECEAYELCICLEVAEHISKENAKKFIEFICKKSNQILFSAAIPGQGGVCHLNEAWPSYWESIFSENGFYVEDFLRSKIWSDDKIPFWYRQNILLFKKTKALEVVTNKGRALDLVHPQLYIGKVINKRYPDFFYKIKSSLMYMVKKYTNRSL